jgi:hypothetical protein
MTAPVSVRTMLLQLAGLADTRDVSDWENSFIKSVLDRTDNAARTSGLSEKQLESIEAIWRKHFAG